jgi:LysM repeat protein
MKITRVIVLLVAAAAIILSACTRPAATAPTGLQASPTFPDPNQNLGGLDSNSTATAFAATVTPGAEQPAPAPTDTPVPVAPEATATPVSAIATAVLERPATYKLQKGEFPYCIARRYNVNPSDLLSQNGLGANSTVYAGQELKIPQSGSFPGDRSLRTHPADYTVKAGDTIYTIACYFGDVNPMDIAAQNGLSEPYTLSAGTTLRIP